MAEGERSHGRELTILTTPWRNHSTETHQGRADTDAMSDAVTDRSLDRYLINLLLLPSREPLFEGKLRLGVVTWLRAITNEKLVLD